MTDGQITKSNKDAVERIIDRMLSGLTLRAAVEAEHVTVRTFHRWISGDREAGLLYARALELLSDLEVDEAKEIADNEPDAAKARNQIDIRKWRATKRHARVYGERVDLNVSQTIDISATLAEARARILRPVQDQLGVSDAQVIDLPRQIVQSARDKQSLDRPQPGDEPNIFD
jgi:hypothetical protein